jgi:hypothetical protein
MGRPVQDALTWKGVATGAADVQYYSPTSNVTPVEYFGLSLIGARQLMLHGFFNGTGGSPFILKKKVDASFPFPRRVGPS